MVGESVEDNFRQVKVLIGQNKLLVQARDLLLPRMMSGNIYSSPYVKEKKMESKNPTFHATLFYSYCHKDEKYRESMETSLALLKREGLLDDWSDQKILPGQSISQKIEEKINEADIMVFLVSQHFIESEGFVA